jgi:UDP-glucose 4-epimerase
MKHAVVTGATGFIAIHLIDQLLQDGYQVDAIVRPASTRIYRLKQHSRLNVIELDMQEIALLKERLTSEVDEFYHLAWEGARFPLNENQTLQNTNYLASLEALKTAIECGCKTFVGAGSQAEYGPTQEIIRETSPTNPVSEYGKFKLRMFTEGSALAKRKGIHFVWARIFSVYGEEDFSSTLIMTCLSKMLKHDEIRLGPCTQDWDYIYVEDAAQSLQRLGRSDCPSGVYNIASGISRPLMEYVLKIKEITQSRSSLHFDAANFRENNQVNLKPSIEKLQTALNWKPETGFDYGIERIILSMKEKQT